MSGWGDLGSSPTDPSKRYNGCIFNCNGSSSVNILGSNSLTKIIEYNSPFHDNCLHTLDGTPIRTLYISKIPSLAVWKDVHRAFAVFGKIKKLFLKTEIDRPFAFVTFLSPESALKAFYQSTIVICNKKVCVKKADSWHQPIVNAKGIFNWAKQDRKTMDEEDGEDGDSENEDDDEEGDIENDAMEAMQSPSCSIENRDNIQVLNDDCLSYIFSFLNYNERVCCERVCKRWRAINSLIWRQVHTLDFSLSNGALENIPLNMVSLDCFLKKCSDSLKVLNLCRKQNYLNNRVIYVISKYCKNLEELHILKMPIGDRCLPYLAQYCNKLKKIAFLDCKHFTDTDLFKLFASSMELTSVTITNASGISGLALGSLYAPLEQLNLNDCINLDAKMLIQCLNKSSSTLKELSLNSCYARIRGDDFNNIIKAVPNLERLSLAQSNPHLSQSSILSIGSLSSLKYLDLSFNRKVCDNIITAIVDGCKELSCLNVSGPKIRNNDVFPLTEAGLAKLGRLRKLTELNISYLNQTSDDCVKNITTKSSCLRVLTCIGCPNLTDVGCTQVVSLCNNLELFDISGNDNITNETIKTALDSIKLCSSRKPLELIIGGTSVIPELLTIDDKRLIINGVDNCKMHMRPDFVDNLFFPPSDDDDILQDALGIPGLSFDIMLHEYFIGVTDSEEESEMEDDSMSDSDCVVFNF